MSVGRGEKRRGKVGEDLMENGGERKEMPDQGGKVEEDHEKSKSERR